MSYGGWKRLMISEMAEYIDRVYRMPFYRSGLCLGKSIRIIRAARALDYPAKLVICISHPTRSALFGSPGYFLHFYAVVDGVKVDVAFSPELEEKRMRNEDVGMTRGIQIPLV